MTTKWTVRVASGASFIKKAGKPLTSVTDVRRNQMISETAEMASSETRRRQKRRGSVAEPVMTSLATALPAPGAETERGRRTVFNRCETIWWNVK